MRGQRDERARWVGAGGAVVAILAIAVALTWTPATHGPRPEGSAPPSDPPAVGPVVYYEVLDAEGSHLLERRLDGRSLARTVATRTDVDYGRTWIVDPLGTTAIAVVPGPDDQALEAITIATGAPLWSVRTPSASVEQAVWSTDGRRLVIASLGTDISAREAIVIDATSGTFVRVAIPDDAIVQGFDRDGSVILRRHLPSPQGVDVAWQFLRVDPTTASVSPVQGLPDVGPASDWSEDVDPAAALAVDTTIGANDEGTAIRLWPLRGGAPRVLATLPSVDRIGIDPTGTGVAVSAAQKIRFLGFDGRATDVFSGPDPIADFAWSAAGDYLAVSTDRRGPNLTVVERQTGRSLELPHPDAVAQLLLVRIIGGVPLPEPALPAVEPSPSPTLAPSGADVAGFAGLVSGWVERTETSRLIRVQRLVPTEAGGLRVVADMPPLDIGPTPVPDDGGPDLRLLPRPGSRDLLVWVGTGDRASGWLWDGTSGVRPLDLPPDWPDNAYDVAWRPDGQAIAASAGRASAEGEFEGIFVIASPGGSATRVLPIVGAYDRLEGWWSAGELRVGHGICMEGCEGRYANDARLRLADHHLTPMTTADRAHAPIDEVTADPDAGTLVLSLINDDKRDDIIVGWPAELGPVEGLDVIGFAADGRTLLIAQGTPTGTDLYGIDDPIGRAVAGRLLDPRPVRLVHLDGRGLRVDVAPDIRWAVVIDRVDNVRLVRLADGRSWSIDRDRTLVWLASG